MLFLARRVDIASMLEAGHMKRPIYEKVFPTAALSYSLFCRYIRRHITNEESQERTRKQPADKPTTLSAGGRAEPQQEQSDVIAGTVRQFKHILPGVDFEIK